MPASHLRRVTLSASTPGLSRLGVNAVAQDLNKAIEPTKNVKRQAEPASVSAATTTAAAASAGASTSDFFTGPITGEPNDKWWPYQWAPRSIGAPAAWAKGINGKGVRVAVVDGSFANITFETDTDEPHGLWVSGIIGAEANNGRSVVGVAYGSTLIGVQVFDERTAPDSTIIQGILYAAERKDKGGAGADIINLSLGSYLDRSDLRQNKTTGEDRENVMMMFNKALAFANKNGVLVVASAGNDVIDFNSQKSNFTSPCESANVICVAANAPVGICPGPCEDNDVICLAPNGLDFAGANYSRLASYSNYGRAVDVTAPGGDFANAPNPCFFDDFIATTTDSGFTLWASGTSFSAPHVSALAALYIQKAAMD
ncbi:hypothetical protein HYH03_011937 [Edaphochlamys debaryana]|uniref:Peptidase S8/S53 domain-containing protein n=1 Tax=Edaphochlamys debaryana TaxID=47281 RepID=A0A835XTY0_9CHLO|nr:hypothetical protein HYH03_011937 [Edaphochlamys debaryana]|eukprot:KAG2489660.1 hypothetical protein HYH03_011937 [Edaphochlamys debaryana]